MIKKIIDENRKASIERWEELNLLDGLRQEEKQTIANNYDIIAQLLLSFDLSVWLFPITRTILSRGKDKKIDFVKLVSILAQVYYDVRTGKRVYPADVDVEAEMCLEVVETYLGKDLRN